MTARNLETSKGEKMTKLKILMFEYSGKMGHFRKFFSTTTSLSYIFPPRTAILGMIGAALGFENYNEVVKELGESLVGIRVQNPVRRYLLTENYLMIKNVTEKELRGRGTRTQIRMEIIMPEPHHKDVRYTVFFYNENYLDELFKRIKEKRFGFPIYLGISEFLARLSDPKIIDASYVENPKGRITTDTVTRYDKVHEIRHLESGARLYREERVPAEMGLDRDIKRVTDYLVPVNGKVELDYEGPVLKISDTYVGIL